MFSHHELTPFPTCDTNGFAFFDGGFVEGDQLTLIAAHHLNVVILLHGRFHYLGRRWQGVGERRLPRGFRLLAEDKVYLQHFLRLLAVIPSFLHQVDLQDLPRLFALAFGLLRLLEVRRTSQMKVLRLLRVEADKAEGAPVGDRGLRLGLGWQHLLTVLGFAPGLIGRLVDLVSGRGSFLTHHSVRSLYFVGELVRRKRLTSDFLGELILERCSLVEWKTESESANSFAFFIYSLCRCGSLIPN